MNNASSSIPINSIGENCRSILRERCRIEQTCHYPISGFATFSQEECSSDKYKPCYTTSTNPICSSYGIENIRVPLLCCKEPTCSNTLSGISPTKSGCDYVCHSSSIDGNRAPMQPILNRETGHVQYLSIPSENCIKMITDEIINNIRYKIGEEEIALLCCCLPSLIRQIMSKTPWLTPNDIIRWLSSDIIKEAMDCFDKNDLNYVNRSDKAKENNMNKDKSKKVNDYISMKSYKDDNHSLSSYKTRINKTSQHFILSPTSSQSFIHLPNNIHKKQNKNNKKPSKIHEKNKIKTGKLSIDLLNSKENNDKKSNKFIPLTDIENKSKKSSIDIEDDNKSISSDSDLSEDSFDSNENFYRKTLQSNSIAKKRENQSSLHYPIEYPGKKYQNARKDVEKCLDFYHKIREYFDDDIAAMLLKCCLCYQHCSTNK
ncbi:unnamed protein product [Rotaria sordida]|uniref:Uncharacterized protein n=1 Tax=Rotaria sordida TaxID=392033 RepID=A0A814H2L5_9BILA|nr:unnamed protein product [Rotaria sordida]CAF1004203.1 unnamed protein product [Rotaria sordida]CAF3565275.1 unnamed protein product [Rotaria sordida]CAF3763132.1 unnamed protein product [Rotaria sordida]